MKLLALILLFAAPVARADTLEDFLPAFFDLAAGVGDSREDFAGRVTAELETFAPAHAPWTDGAPVSAGDWALVTEQHGAGGTEIYVDCFRFERASWDGSASLSGADEMFATKVRQMRNIFAEIGARYDVRPPERAGRMLTCAAGSAGAHLSSVDDKAILAELSQRFDQVIESGTFHTGSDWEVLVMDGPMTPGLWLHSFYMLTPIRVGPSGGELFEPGFYFVAFEIMGES